MGKRLFVGGLSYSINDGQLKDLFSKFGTVTSANVITDKFTGQSKGFGFVEMGSDDEAEKAIQGLNQTDVDGRRIAVDVAKPREDRPRDDFRGGSKRNSRGRPNRW